jgi:tetratricopeptide (TPR) repeat protein
VGYRAAFHLAAVLVAGIIFAVILSGCAPAVNDRASIPASVDASDLGAVRDAEQAMASFNRGRYLDAVFGFHRALTANPALRNLQVSLAASYERLGLPGEAVVWYDRLLQLQPEDTVLMAAKARALAKGFQFREALTLYAKAQEILLTRGETGPAAGIAQSISALSFLIGDEQGALCGAMDALAYAPSRPTALQVIRLLISYSEIARAGAQLALLREDPSAVADPIVLLLMGQHAFLQRDYEDATLFTERARRAQPPDPIDRLEIESFLLILKGLSAASTQANTPEEVDEDEENIIVPDTTFLMTRGLYWPPRAQWLLADFIARRATTD